MVTPVTVIEAGPCPVVQVKTVETDGYEAVQLAFEAVAERKISKAELGHLKKGGAGAHRHLVEFRGFSRGRRRRAGHGRGVPAGRPDQGHRDRHRQGLRRHDQAAPLPPRPEDARLAQHPQAGLDRRVGDPVACLQGHEDGRAPRRQARHPGRAARARDRRREQPAARQGRRPGPEERHRRDQGGEGRMPSAKAPLLDCWRHVLEAGHARRRRVRRRGQAASRSRDRPRRAERAARGHARREEPWPRLGWPRQAVAPEGHGPRPRRHHARPALDRRWRRVPADDAHVRPEGQPQGQARSAARLRWLLTRKQERSL